MSPKEIALKMDHSSSMTMINRTNHLWSLIERSESSFVYQNTTDEGLIYMREGKGVKEMGALSGVRLYIANVDDDHGAFYCPNVHWRYFLIDRMAVSKETCAVMTDHRLCEPHWFEINRPTVVVRGMYLKQFSDIEEKPNGILVLKKCVGSFAYWERIWKEQ